MLFLMHSYSRSSKSLIICVVTSVSSISTFLSPLILLRLTIPLMTMHLKRPIPSVLSKAFYQRALTLIIIPHSLKTRSLGKKNRILDCLLPINLSSTNTSDIRSSLLCNSMPKSILPEVSCKNISSHDEEIIWSLMTRVNYWARSINCWLLKYVRSWGIASLKLSSLFFREKSLSALERHENRV